MRLYNTSFLHLFISLNVRNNLQQRLVQGSTDRRRVGRLGKSTAQAQAHRWTKQKKKQTNRRIKILN